MLVIDDEPTVREVVATYLARDGYLVRTVADGGGLPTAMSSFRPDLVVLDLMLPDANGIDLLLSIRSTSDIPVIVLTARVEEADRVLGLELGADDYVSKPFSPRELVARVRSVLRRSDPPARQLERIELDGLVIDARSREVRLGDAAVALTPKEFDLLAFLATNPRQVFSRAQLLAQVWDSTPDYQDPATVTVHVGRLRQKLEIDPENPRWIATVFGVGYRFEG